MIDTRKHASARKKRIGTIATLFMVAIGVILWGGFNTAMEATNRLEFCISCHEMETTVYREYLNSAHYTNASGVQAVCADCHVPKEWTRKLARKIKASKELYAWMVGTIDTVEKFEARRLELAQRVWVSMQESDSRECRNCHGFSMMNLADQGRFAARVHADGIEDDQTCIDCHKGITHQLPREKLAGRLPAKLSRDNLEYAEEINDTCAGCHGEFGEGSLDGEYPRLAGMNPDYLARQIKHFKSRERLNIPMLPYATDRELPAEDIEIISNYLATIDLPTELPAIEESSFNAFERLQQSKKVINIPRYPGSLKTGSRLYAKECAACHGADGYGSGEELAPQLAGQHSIYLKRQIDAFRSHERLHDDPRDAEIFQAFDDSEIDNILAWLSVADDSAARH